MPVFGYFSTLLKYTLLLPLVAGVYGQVFVDFNTIGDMDTEFSTSAVSGLWTSPTETGGGLSGTNGMGPGPLLASAQVWTYDDAFAGDTASWTVGYYFREWYLIFNTGTLSVGFTTDATPAHSTLGLPANSLGLILKQSTSGSESIALTNMGSELASASIGNISSGGSWFFLELSVVYNSGPDNYTLTGRLYNSSSTGVLGSLRNSVSTTTSNTLLSADPDAYLFLGTNGSPNVRTLDNFSSTVTPIPEPSEVGLIFGVFVVLGSLLYRKLKPGP
ncbi:MAG TPA: hypothetical protein DIU37_05530 [Opitutae bacterium]|nr:hypothetical protein [Opitutae bacterium]|tara:strand:+ start:1594 stop:2418 length:825 start_codon:yes stop_codon:yes gene_type:complete